MQHLAELIEEEMAERGWDLERLVTHMGPFKSGDDYGICYLSWEMFLELRLPEVVLGEPMAKQLGKAFDITPNFFTNFHEAWRQAAKAN